MCEPVQNVEIDSGATVAEMAEGIGGDTTDVHADLARYFWLEALLLASHRVINHKLLFAAGHSQTTHTLAAQSSV